MSLSQPLAVRQPRWCWLTLILRASQDTILSKFLHRTNLKAAAIIYAYGHETDEILAVTAGKCSKKHLKDLLKRLGDITVDWWCSDAWKVFKETLPYDQHLIEKNIPKQ